MNALVGKKIGMTQVYDDNRCLHPVTVIEAGPCGVTAVKTTERHGYDAVQIGFQETKERKLPKAELGHLRAGGHGKLWKYLKEFRGVPDCQVGDTVSVSIFEKGERVDVQGISRGKGFQGVIKRHNFAGGPASHGSMFHRAPGSIGQSSFPSRVFKNKDLPGHMGNKRITIKGLSVFDVRSEENILLVSGSIPGPIGGMVIVRKAS